MPLVTVVVPAHNAGSTLQATLTSLEQQTASEWTSIVVDDRSTDQTRQIAEDFATKPDSRVITGRFGSASAARNAGASLATTRWLLFLDADDLIEPTHLEQLLTRGSNPDIHFVYSGSSALLPNGRLEPNELPPANEHFRHLARTCIFKIHACLVDRSLFERVGCFDETLTTCEDWDLWQKVMRTNPQRATTGTQTAIYRMLPGSLSRQAPQLLEDGDVVIQRGHGPDQRFNSPAWRNGVRDEVGCAEKRFRYGLWVAGIAAETGNGLDSVLQHVRKFREAVAVDIVAGEIRNGYQHAQNGSVKEKEIPQEILAEIAAAAVPSAAEEVLAAYKRNQPVWTSSHSDVELASRNRFEELKNRQPSVERDLLSSLADWSFGRGGKVAIDAGAGSGNFATSMTSAGFEVIGYEALPATAENLRTKTIPDLAVRQIALSDERRSSATFEEVLAKPAHSALKSALINTSDDNQFPIATIDVQTTTLDDDLSAQGIAHEEVGLIKAHLVGGEYQMLLGATSTLRRGRPLCYLFNGFHAPAVYGYRRDDFQRLITDLGYVCVTPTGLETTAQWTGSPRLVLAPQETLDETIRQLKDSFDRLEGLDAFTAPPSN